LNNADPVLNNLNNDDPTLNSLNDDDPMLNNLNDVDPILNTGVKSNKSDPYTTIFLLIIIINTLLLLLLPRRPPFADSIFGHNNNIYCTKEAGQSGVTTIKNCDIWLVD
jgi:hypothetical protein